MVLVIVIVVVIVIAIVVMTMLKERYKMRKTCVIASTNVALMFYLV